MRINTEATRCLGTYLDMGLQFSTLKILILLKIRKVDDRVCDLTATTVLESWLVLLIQVAAIQAMAL